MIRMNHRGPAVEQLQRDLTAAGHPVEVDGVFGPATLAAVLEFQGRKGLVADGVVGPKTLAALTSPGYGKVLSAKRMIRAWEQELPCGVVVHPDDPFIAPRRRTRVTQIVIHESITHDPDGLEDEPGEQDDATERVLDRRHLGVHLMIGVAPDLSAQVVQHNDLRDALHHTGCSVNDLLVGLEIVNPYYDTAGIWRTAIPARWAHRGVYTLPLLVQVEACYQICLALWLASEAGKPGLEIPRRFWAQDGDSFHLGEVKGDKGAAGVLAHHHYGHHADGAWPALYCALRERGLLPSDAYDCARELAQGRSSTVRLPR